MTDDQNVQKYAFTWEYDTWPNKTFMSLPWHAYMYFVDVMWEWIENFAIIQKGQCIVWIDQNDKWEDAIINQNENWIFMLLNILFIFIKIQHYV